MRELILSPPPEQKLELQPARVLDLRALDLRAAAGCGRQVRNCAARPAMLPDPIPREILQHRHRRHDPVALPPPDLAEEVDLLQKTEAERKLPIPRFPSRPRPALVLLRNKQAAREAEQVYRRVWRVSFCDAASGRASIYACKAFNTEESAGSIGGPTGEPSATAAQMFGVLATFRAEPSQCRTRQNQFHPPFAARNMSL